MRLISKKKLPKISRNKFKRIIKFSTKFGIFLLIYNFLIIGVGIKFRKEIIYSLRYVKTLNKSDLKNYAIDIFNSFKMENQIDNIQLSINFKNLNRLDCQRERKSNCGGDWARGTLISNKETFPIKIRAKGDRAIHRIDLDNMSFKVDIRGTKRYRGMEEFSIQKPIIRNYTSEILVSELIKESNIISPRHSYIKLYLNGKYLGLRHLEESYSRELIEANERRYGPVYGLDENTVLPLENYGLYYKKYQLQDSKNWTKNNLQQAKTAFSVLEHSQNNQEIIKEYFDQNLWAKYFALMDIFSTYHGAIEKSVKIYLNPVTGLFEPAFFDGHKQAVLPWDNFLLIDFMQNDVQKINCEWICGHKSWFRSFFGTEDKPNVEFINHYLAALKKFSSKEYQEAVLDKNIKKLSPLRGLVYRGLHGYDAPNNFNFPIHVAQLSQVKNKIKNIRELLNYKDVLKPFFSTNDNIQLISVTNQTSSIPQLISFKCNNSVSEKYVLNRAKSLIFDFSKLDNCNINNMIYSLDNFKNSSYIKDDSLGNINFERKFLLDSKDKINIKVKKKKQKIIFKGDNLEVNNDLILKEKFIEIPKNFTICLNNNANLVVSNSILNQSEKGSNLLIKGCGKTSGTVIIENSKINLDEINLMGLSNPIKPLRTLYGGLNVIKSEFNFGHLKIINSQSEDGVNFINSRVNGEKFYANNIKSDALDSDYSLIDIKNIECRNIFNDCLDTSFSDVFINKLLASDIGDKGISVGEISNVNIKNVYIKNTEIGVAVKDSSKLNLDTYKADSTKLPLAVYIKKKEMGSPVVDIKSFPDELIKESLISNDSQVNLSGTKILGTKKSEIISNMLYGKMYGVKTIR